MKAGKVYLVGAGPGDPGLLTMKAHRCLSETDVVVYDHLADERLLGFVPLRAERIYVGKKSSEHTMEQSQINRLLVEKALEGKNVVRLKGGDPFVFGRGGEEAEELANSNIEFEIVPGISSSVAVPVYAGIPVTHRNAASSFAVITGHEDPAKKESKINWEKLATSSDTLVFLMGMQNLPHIAEQLIRHGREPGTPVAVIKDGTLSTQETVTGELSDIAHKVKEKGMTPPAVIVVGEVVRLRDKLRWFDKFPLFGKRVLVTRSRHQASALSKLLGERGAVPVELPTINVSTIEDTHRLDAVIARLKEFDWVIFTSANGVEAFFARLKSLHLDSRVLGASKVGVIGSATADALGVHGVLPDYFPDVFTGAALLAGLFGKDVTGKKILLLRADIADEALAQGLKSSGATVEEVNVYRTTRSEESDEKIKKAIFNHEIDVITFTSSSTVTNFAAVFGSEQIPADGIKIACIGPKTAETAIKHGLKPDILASVQTIPGLVEAIENYFQKVA